MQSFCWQLQQLCVPLPESPAEQVAGWILRSVLPGRGGGVLQFLKLLTLEEPAPYEKKILASQYATVYTSSHASASTGIILPRMLHRRSPSRLQSQLKLHPWHQGCTAKRPGLGHLLLRTLCSMGPRLVAPASDLERFIRRTAAGHWYGQAGSHFQLAPEQQPQHTAWFPMKKIIPLLSRIPPGPTSSKLLTSSSMMSNLVVRNGT